MYKEERFSCTRRNASRVQGGTLLATGHAKRRGVSYRETNCVIEEEDATTMLDGNLNASAPETISTAQHTQHSTSCWVKCRYCDPSCLIHIRYDACEIPMIIREIAILVELRLDSTIAIDEAYLQAHASRARLDLMPTHVDIQR